MSNHSTSLVLRNYPDDDALPETNLKGYSKALSFSPDIIPLYGKTVAESTLVDPACLRGFTGFPIVGGHVNNVYIRGYGSGGTHIASLRVFPSELILWPQVWYDVQPVPSGPAVISAGDTKGPYISDRPLQFRPQHTTGNTYSLVANVVKHVPNDKPEYLPPPPPFDLKRFGVDDFVKFLSNDETYTFYNVIVADPTLKHVSATTRLRMIGNLPVVVTLRIAGHDGASLPPGSEVSLVDDQGKITIPRTPLPPKSCVERPFLLEPSYDGILMLNVFAPAGNTVFEPYSGLSLKAFHNVKLPLDLFPQVQLLGALNVIFEPHSTRNLRFANPAATQPKESKNSPGKAEVDSNLGNNYGPIPVTKPAATGWWTRAALKDENNFPHTQDIIGYSPDIQPVGTDLAKENFVTILQNSTVDYSGANNIELVGNQNNYVYLRGHSTIADIDVQSRLFAISTSTLNYPTHYLKEGLPGTVVGASNGTVNETVNEITISDTNTDQFYLFDKPFNFSHPSADPSNHYCIIGEVRQKRKDCPVWPGWPSDQWDNYATQADFETWCLSCPLACWRNIGWEPCQSEKDNCRLWPFSTKLCIPDCSFYSSFWTIIIECDNSVIPPGSTWWMTCDDNEIFLDNKCFENSPIDQNSPISAQSPAFAGCHFAGARPGYEVNFTLFVSWCDGGDSTKFPPPNVKWRLAMTETLVSPILHLAMGAPPGSETWPFYVTKDYPHIGSQPNPSPLPSFKSAGLNPWPYKDALQFSLGQVTLTGKPE